MRGRNINNKSNNISSDFDHLESLSKKERILRYASPFRSTFYFVLPTVIIMTVLSLYNLADKLMAQLFAAPNLMNNPHIQQMYQQYLGHPPTIDELKQNINLSTQYSYVIFNLGSAFASFFAVGASVLYSIEYGKRNFKKMSIIFNNGITFSVVISIIVCFILFFFTYPPFGSLLIGIQEGSEKNPINTYLTWHYVYVFLIVMPLLAVNYMFMSILRSQGKTAILIFLNISSLLLNVFLDWVIIKYGGLDLDGAMWATAISWVYNIAFFFFIIHFEKDKNLRFNFKDFKIIDLHILRGGFTVGLTPFFIKVSNAFISVISAYFITHLDGSPQDPATNNYILQQMMSSMMPWILILLNISIGISQGVRVVMAYSYGAKKHERIKHITYLTLFVLVGWMLIFDLAILAFGPYMAMAFAFPREYAFEYRWEIFLFNYSYPLFGVTYTAITLFNSIKRPARSAILSLFRSAIVLLVLSLIGFYTSNYIYNNVNQDNPGLAYVIANGSNDLVTFFITIGVVIPFAMKNKHKAIDHEDIIENSSEGNNGKKLIKEISNNQFDSENDEGIDRNNLTQEIKN